MSGESSLTLTPIPPSSPACSETNREASQHSSTKQCGHTAATTTPACPTGTFGTVSPATADRTNHPQTYSKPSWNSIPHVWLMQTNPPSASSASCDTKAYASASSPTPRTPSQKQSVAPNGGAFSTSSLSPATMASASPPAVSTATYSTASELPSKTSPSSTTVAKMFAPLN